jgi:DNA-binding MarR family transcriptional regulator
MSMQLRWNRRVGDEWLDDLEMRAWLGYRRMQGLLDREVARDLAADSGLSEPDYHVLSTLSETPDADWRLREFADRLLWSPSRLSHQLTRMERRGLVERSARPGDPRGATIRLTRQGRAAVEAAAPAHVRSVRRHVIDMLSRDQLRALTEITETVLSHLQRPDGSADGAAPPR